MRPERVGGVATTELMAAGGGGARPPSPWRTPTPYLFLGFAVMMGLIMVALLVLICTRHKSSSSSAEKPAPVRVLVPLDREEPKVVVIMAGDALPSFIAVACAATATANKPPLAFGGTGTPAGPEAV